MSREKESAHVPGKGEERLFGINSGREKLISESSDDVVAAVEAEGRVAFGMFTDNEMEVEGIKATREEIFKYAYVEASAGRTVDMSYYLASELDKINLRFIGHYRTLFSEILDKINYLRSAIRQYYGDMPRDYENNQPLISTHTGLQHHKDFSDGILKMYDFDYAILVDNIERAEDGRDDPDYVRWKGKLQDDELCEDSNYFKALLEDIESGVIKNKKQLLDLVNKIRTQARGISETARKRRETIEETAAFKNLKFKRKGVSEPTVEGREVKETGRTPHFFDVLGITMDEYKTSTNVDELIKKKYRAAAMNNHPDRAEMLGVSPAELTERTKEVNCANDTLSDPDKRRKYLVYWKLQ